MPAPIVLPSVRNLRHSAVFNNRSESERWLNAIRGWRKDNPDIKPSDPRMLLVEELFRVHIFLQRLYDKRFFWDGTPTLLQAENKHEYSLPEEECKRKQQEFDKYYPRIHSSWRALMRLALQNKLTVDLNTEELSVQQLFGAMDLYKEKGDQSAKNGSYDRV